MTSGNRPQLERVDVKITSTECAINPKQNKELKLTMCTFVCAMTNVRGGFNSVMEHRFGFGRLNAHWFLSLADAREKMEDWRNYYNEGRPHRAIGRKTPIMLLNHIGATSPPS
jgi:transposase InsO family protein